MVHRPAPEAPFGARWRPSERRCSVAAFWCATGRHVPGGDERTPPLACRSRPLKLGAARAWRRRGGWEQPRQRRDGWAPPDHPGPASEMGRCNASEPVAKAPQSRRRLQPGGCGPVRSARPPRGGRLRSRFRSSVGRPWGRTVAYPWRCCRSKAGRLPRRPVHGERGNHPGIALPAAQPGWRRAGPSSADEPRVGRRTRSSPRPGCDTRSHDSSE